MTDPTSIASAIQALKAASDMIKGMRGADFSLEKAELKLRLADLAESLVSARTAVLDAQQEIGELRARIAELERAQNLSERMEFRNNVYFVTGESGSNARPYCPRCFDADDALIHLAELPPGFRDLARYSCANCKGTF